MPGQADATIILQAVQEGREPPAARLMPLVYENLRAMAAAIFSQQACDHTLQPTALVHEAFLKLISGNGRWESRAHFLAVAARAMRQVLINHARDQAAMKRGGGRRPAAVLDHVQLTSSGVNLIDAMALEEALQQLARLNERVAQVVELRFFGGLTADEAAQALNVSKRTVESDWEFARAWLARALREATVDDS